VQTWSFVLRITFSAIVCSFSKAALLIPAIIFSGNPDKKLKGPSLSDSSKESISELASKSSFSSLSFSSSNCSHFNL